MQSSTFYLGNIFVKGVLGCSKELSKVDVFIEQSVPLAIIDEFTFH